MYGCTCRGGYKVEATNKGKRDNLSGTWKIVSRSGKYGAVLHGDLVHIVNQLDPSKGYLDTYGDSGRGGYGVETTDTGNRVEYRNTGNGTGTWMIGKDCFNGKNIQKSSKLIQI